MQREARPGNLRFEATAGPLTTAETYRVSVSGEATAAIRAPVGTTIEELATLLAAAVNANVNMPVTAASAAGVVTLTVKWQGSNTNVITATVLGGAGGAIDVAVSVSVPGASNPTVDTALGLFGNVWETIVINGLELADATALDTYQTVGEGRWGATVRKPFWVATGNTDAALANATAVSDGRKLDMVGVMLNGVGFAGLAGRCCRARDCAYRSCCQEQPRLMTTVGKRCPGLFRERTANSGITWRVMKPSARGLQRSRYAMA